LAKEIGWKTPCFYAISMTKREIICCVLSRLHNHLLEINLKNAFHRINFFARNTPKNHSNVVVVRKGEKRGI